MSVRKAPFITFGKHVTIVYMKLSQILGHTDVLDVHVIGRTLGNVAQSFLDIEGNRRLRNQPKIKKLYIRNELRSSFTWDLK